MSGERYRLTWASSLWFITANVMSPLRSWDYLVSNLVILVVSFLVCFKLADWFQKRRLLNNFPIGSYVKTMSADGDHFEPGWSLSGQFSKLCPVTLTSIQDGHLQRTYCSFNIGPYGKKCFKIFSSEKLGWGP
jgi:hypothetical protein